MNLGSVPLSLDGQRRKSPEFQSSGLALLIGVPEMGFLLQVAISLNGGSACLPVIEFMKYCGKMHSMSNARTFGRTSMEDGMVPDRCVFAIKNIHNS